ncbi:MarR family winged helix-turn-helix transcriptional regulator [Specibacter sp. AOP5-B1-6]|uniref:MarR family winged helix-turn-helix transcriptional regulator n=1 Tax=Specibacter sp. AOP5-B1-6 TaxID=3457653 RepID=UPI003FB96D12
MTPVSAQQVAANAAKLAALNDLDTQLSLLWRRARAINFQLARSVHPDLEPAAYGLLSVLLNQGGMRLTELASRVGVGKPSVSRQISLLASLGLVGKEIDPADRRAQLIELTPAGREKMVSLNAGRQAAFNARLHNWDKDEVASLAVLVAKLNAAYIR